MHPSASSDRSEDPEKVVQETKQWVEAEEWLTHCYPEFEWEAEHRGDVIFIVQLDNKKHAMFAQVPQKKFREWTSITDFQHAMNHLLHMHCLVHWKDFNWSEF